MKRLNIVIDVAFKKLTQEDWDNVLIIGGDEGTGKSTLGLHITDGWYNRLYGSCPPSHINKISLSMSGFVKSLKELKKYELINYDEAGELSSLRMMNKFNYAVMSAYQVIRGENLFTILIMPDIFYLNPFFSTRRARGYIHVYNRGEFAYWNKRNLRTMIQINKDKKNKTPWRVKPLFYDHFPRYKGELLDPYKKLKAEKTESVRDELYQKLVVEETQEFRELELYYKAYKLIGAPKTSEIFGVTRQTVYNKVKEYRQIHNIKD